MNLHFVNPDDKISDEELVKSLHRIEGLIEHLEDAPVAPSREAMTRIRLTGAMAQRDEILRRLRKEAD